MRKFLIALAFGAQSVSAFAAPHSLTPVSSLSVSSVARHRGSVDAKLNKRAVTSTQLHGYRDAWLLLRGGVSDDVLAAEAFDWCSNLGSPAALVAGAVLATLSSTRAELTPCKGDTTFIQNTKKTCRFLLLSAFALEVFCIFVTTVTGTMLLSHGDIPAGVHGGVHYHSPMGFMAYNHEFEYLTSRVTFLQGLFNWLVAVALQFVIRQPGESTSAHKMNIHISSWLISMVLIIIQFYNDHITFYPHYGYMLWRYLTVTWHRYFWTWPARPMALLTVPSIVTSLFLGMRAFKSHADDEDTDEK